MSPPLMQPQDPNRRRRDPLPLSPWEIAVWTLTTLVVLLLLSAIVQHALDVANA